MAFDCLIQYYDRYSLEVKPRRQSYFSHFPIDEAASVVGQCLLDPLVPYTADSLITSLEDSEFFSVTRDFFRILKSYIPEPGYALWLRGMGI